METVALIFSILSNAAFLALLGCAFAAVVQERRAEKRPDPKFKIGEIVTPKTGDGQQWRIVGMAYIDDAWFYAFDKNPTDYIRETELEAR